MYVYLYDNFLKKKKYVSTMKVIENKLTDFGISGRILRLQHFVNPENLVMDEIRRGAKTVVIVGNDDTLSYVLTRAATLDTTFGFIPVGPDNTMAQVLGIPTGDKACDVLSKRRTVDIDIGEVSNKNRFFIAKLDIPPADINVIYDNKFSVSSSSGLMSLTVTNLIPYEWSRRWSARATVRPQDRRLDAYLRPLVKQGVVRHKLEEPSIFQFDVLEVESADGRAFSVSVDGQESKEKHVIISMSDRRICMVVGRDRQF
jgi:hypothetical protein